ncbi:MULTISPECIES: Do family serine endopeptidase [Bartonella]|uniref:Probable periplasmic serine endoprotease DegP-like n=1 Tax=Bartonella rochalimae ATCC BAA-1498 TaxID=685782 RepID=E6YKU0_9HYPH|nr:MULTISPECIES: Do family serine endopeptidase [Bartonella]AQX18684.1 serine protease Do [Bartonella sp. A1379B]AQX23196.1 serine protease Do [Bartonella sp. 11B]AQX23503.1 serine protease Do [Bartonella sp. 114]AQX25652.1 serine protease Do [Bartonella sp. Coyote22sub2]KEC54188.1 protease Do [Bartonella rochalimae ATCC BAA-1498]
MIRSNFRMMLTAVSCSVFLASTMFFTGSSFWVTNTYANPVFVPSVQQQGFADVVSKVKAAVVSVQVKSNAKKEERFFSNFFSSPGIDQLPDQHPLKRFFKDFYNHALPNNKPLNRSRKFRPIAFGSGFFTSSDGYIVTNHHVIAEGTSYAVILDDGTELEAKLIGADPRTDLAVLKVNDKRKFPYVDFADDSTIHVGDWVVAVGNPFGLGGTVTAGIVSARGRDIGAGVYDDFIQIDAAVNRGNSGGPTFNLNGQVVGINTAIYSPSGGNVGIAFAIPSATAKQVVKQLMEKGSVQRGWIGVQIQAVTKEISDSIGLKESKGALITDPLKGPAAKAGVKAGDVIIAVNGEKINDARDLAKRIANTKPGETVTLGIWRSGKEESIKVKLDSMPADEGQREKGKYSSEHGNSDETLEDYGLIVAPSDDGVGLVVTDVDSDADAADRGVRPGDVIVTVNNRPVKKASDITDAIKDAKKLGRNAILLQVRTNDQNRFIALPILKK